MRTRQAAAAQVLTAEGWSCAGGGAPRAERSKKKNPLPFVELDSIMSAQETVTLTEEAGFKVRPSAPAPAAADVGCKKVFCGNLAFSTTDAELTTVFGAVGEM